MKDLDYIKQFSKISITKACNQVKVDRTNVLNNKASKEKIKKVREELESEVAKLYIRKDD